MDKPKITAFQQRVYEKLKEVPKGYVTTYRELARAIDCGSAQAVGQALRCNPFAPIVPCHRVISSDLTIGGFYGEKSGEQIAKKTGLLAKEGVTFVQGVLFDQSRLFYFK